jgi:hypothetical protein
MRLSETPAPEIVNAGLDQDLLAVYQFLELLAFAHHVKLHSAMLSCDSSNRWRTACASYRIMDFREAILAARG